MSFLICSKSCNNSFVRFKNNVFVRIFKFIVYNT